MEEKSLAEEIKDSMPKIKIGGNIKPLNDPLVDKFKRWLLIGLSGLVAGMALILIMGARSGTRYNPVKALAYYAVDTASNDTYVAQVSGLDGYFTGLLVLLNPVTANTDAATLNINGLGAKAIVGEDGNALTTNDLLSTGISHMVYDGTNFLLQE